MNSLGKTHNYVFVFIFTMFVFMILRIHWKYEIKSLLLLLVLLLLLLPVRIPTQDPDIAYQVSIERDDEVSVTAGAHGVNVLRFVSEQSCASLSCSVGFKRF